MVEALAAHGADANLAASGDVTALHAAAEMGDLPTIKALIKVSSLLSIMKELVCDRFEDQIKGIHKQPLPSVQYASQQS